MMTRTSSADKTFGGDLLCLVEKYSGRAAMVCDTCGGCVMLRTADTHKHSLHSRQASSLTYTIDVLLVERSN